MMRPLEIQCSAAVIDQRNKKKKCQQGHIVTFRKHYIKADFIEWQRTLDSVKSVPVTPGQLEGPYRIVRGDAAKRNSEGENCKFGLNHQMYNECTSLLTFCFQLRHPHTSGQEGTSQEGTSQERTGLSRTGLSGGGEGLRPA